jgi:diguanylate cyclase (GGDEF)-like protein
VRPSDDGHGTAEAAQLLETNRRLGEAARRRDDLLALAAHELRSPAATLLRELRHLRRGAATLPDAEQRILERLDVQARRIAGVADSLLAAFAVEAGQPQPTDENRDVRGIVADVVATRRRMARARSIELTCELPAHHLALPVDGELLRRMTAALLDSALEATPPRGRVRLAVEGPDGGVRIVLEDERPEPDRPRRAAGGRPDRLAGLDLHLAVCRALADAGGATVEVNARGPRHVAVLSLPESAPTEGRGFARTVAADGEQPRILVADDDHDAREALGMVLADDYQVLLAIDGKDAVQTAVAVRPDLVLMDLYMPRMDGLAALEAMRADPLTEDVPVILISARGDDLTRSRSLDLGAVDFLQKPFSARELKARIERTLRLTRRETHLQELARTDALTGLANLRAFRARLDEELKRARRYRTPLACVMVDMDHLKPINDEMGHAAGDAAIGAVAEVIRHELRETDFGARYGGDEFVLLLPHTSANDARVFAERVCARLREASLEVAGRRLPIGASFGIASLDEDLDDPGDALVRRADAALYAAKRAGRGRVAAHPTSDEEPLPAP